jgi:hypothetical protein
MGRTPKRLSEGAGTALSFVRDPEALSSGAALLLERLTVFDLGWVALFVLALEHQDDAPALKSLVAVSAAALLVLLAQWTGSLYVARLG